MLRSVTVATALLLPIAASAQDPDFVSNEEAKKVLGEGAQPEGQVDGWEFKLQVGLNVSLSDSQSVPGIEDGTTYQVGGAVKASARLLSGDHEWRNTLDVTHTRTSTPPLDEFIKSADDLTLRSMYLYHIPSVSWLGPFARARLSTALFPGELLLAGDVDYTVVPDAPERLTGGTSLDLTSAFEPLLMRQSIGAFANPLDTSVLNLTISVGAGAQEIITQNGRVVAATTPPELRTDMVLDADGNETRPVVPLVIITPLADSTQVGLEVELEATGALTEMVTYSLTVNTLTPFYSDPDKSAADPETGEVLEGAIELTNVDIAGKVGVKLAQWASLDYVLSAKYLPLIVPEWQLTNSLLLNASFNLL